MGGARGARGRAGAGRGFSAGDVEEVHRGLLPWYARKHRVLPWRRRPAGAPAGAGPPEGGPGGPAAAAPGSSQFAYWVWVSEVMLQQTRVQTVVPYFQKWLEMFPSVDALAAAEEEEVTRAWAGLGYYRRARFLHKGARHVVERLGGALPSGVAELKEIPGIGEYTAHAIASIAFGAPVGVVDGNVIRVLSRLLALEGDARAPARLRELWAAAHALAHPAHPGDFNQAVMELGATVCTPKDPSCAACPLAGVCQARQAALAGGAAVTVYPELPKKKKAREERYAVAVLALEMSQCGRRFHLLVQRPADGLLGGLWEFPCVEAPGPQAGADAAARDALLVGLLGPKVWGGGSAALRVVGREPAGEVRHVFTHRVHTYCVEKLRVEIREGHLLEGLPKRGRGGQGLKWVENNLMCSQGLTTGVKKVFELAMGRGLGRTAGAGGGRKPAGARARLDVEEGGLDVKTEPKRPRPAKVGPSTRPPRRRAAAGGGKKVQK